MGAAPSTICACCSSAVHEPQLEFTSLSPAEALIADKASAAEKLQAILQEKPYLDQDLHFLHYYVSECRQALDTGSLEAAQNALDQLLMQVDAEERQIAAAFVRFDVSKDDVLKGDEVKFMIDYLGFPNTPSEIRAVFKGIDRNHDQMVSFDEFLDYVGNMGGSAKLFEIRRRNMGGLGGSSAHSKELQRLELLQCGFQEGAQEAWRLVASEAELDAVVGLEPCQQAALRHIRALAQENHARALPQLQERVARLGYCDNDLWMLLAWIREAAPIIIHVNLVKLAIHLKNDSHYRNQFETNTSSGLKNHGLRIKWERDLFGNAYESAKPCDRPKYGVQNIWNDYRGVVGCKQYGDSYLMLRGVRLRCTFSPEDSANLKASRLSVPDFYGHVLQEYSDKELAEALRVAVGGMAGTLGDSAKVVEQWGKYKEAQVHGKIELSRHVERLVVNERHKHLSQELQEIADKHGFKLTWMDDMQRELQSRSGLHILRGFTRNIEDWRKHHGLPDSQFAGASPSMCRRCCGRPAGPAGKFCCVGCMMGFGHDVTCGRIPCVRLSTTKISAGVQGVVKPASTRASRVLQQAVSPLTSLKAHMRD